MKIIRVVNGQTMEFELTMEEIANAHEIHVTSFMESVLMEDFEFEPEIAKDLAIDAYAEYAKGDGLTEYECIEKIAYEYLMQ